MPRKTGSHGVITGPRVRSAARRLFARYGFAAVSMRQIAADVGVQAGALYTYTPDKQALLFDLMRTHMEEVLAAWTAEAKPDDPVDRLEHFTRFHITHHLERTEDVFISYMELRSLTPEHFRTIVALRRAYEDALEQILIAGQGFDVFRVHDTRLATMAVIAMLNGVQTWFRDGGRLGRDALVDHHWAMVRGAVGCARPPSAASPLSSAEATPHRSAVVSR
ncbi:MAG: TetR/AcrR family transcriptional regulator [Pseudomonadota bacterium]